MIKTYGYTDNTQLSPHFNAQEFRCKCGKEHDFQIDDDLITKLEKLYAVLNCSKIIVTSGFRCVAHDKSVGGSGTGQHTLGKAADTCCYGQDGQPISSKTVCCKAQDTGFTGIANITAAYIYTHVDVRSGSKWYGDEVHGKQFEFPVYFDLEEKKQFDLGKEKVSAIVRAFLERVEAAGYFVGLYGSASSLTTHTSDDIKSRYTIWLAHWVDQTNYSGAYGIWQHSEKGSVDGINGNVDLDIGYKDFPTIIKAKGLNGWCKEQVLPNPPAPAVDDGISVEVTVDGQKYSGKLNKA